MVRELRSMRFALVAALAYGRLALAAPSELGCFPVRGEATVRPISSTQPAVPGPLGGALGVWTGSNLLVWGTAIESMKLPEPPDDFFAYDPTAETWKAFHAKGLPRLKRPTLVWASGRAVLWGGVTSTGSGVTNQGVIFDPATGAVTPTSMVDAPFARQYHAAVTVGGKMLVFGGGGVGGRNVWSCDGALLDPITNRWSPLAPAPEALCGGIQGVQMIAGDRDRAAMLVLLPNQRSQVRAVLYDVTQRRWTVGPLYDAGHPMNFGSAPAFGSDGAAYLIATGDYPDRGGTLLRIDPTDAHLEPVGRVPESGTLIRSGNVLRVVGAGVSTEIDVASRRCVVPMRASAFLNPYARQLLVGTDDGFIVWGHGIGSLVRFGSNPASPMPSSSANIRGAALQDARGHCGGATPPPWSPGPAESPVRDLSLLIRKGARNTDPHVVAEVKTDADGLFEARLAKGQYCVVGAGQRAVTLKLPKSTDTGTRSCLEEENARCLATLEVPADGTEVPVVIHVPNRCFGPCYHGPLPP